MPEKGVSLAGLKTAVLPATSAPALMPVASWFENGRVARDQRAGTHARGERQREVKRRDDGPDPVGFKHAPGLLDAVAAHLRFITIVLLHLPAIIKNQVDGFGNLGDGFEAVLADLEAEQGC